MSASTTTTISTTLMDVITSTIWRNISKI